MTVTCISSQQIHSFLKYRGLNNIFLLRNVKLFYDKLIQIYRIYMTIVELVW